MKADRKTVADSGSSRGNATLAEQGMDATLL